MSTIAPEILRCLSLSEIEGLIRDHTLSAKTKQCIQKLLVERKSAWSQSFQPELGSQLAVGFWGIDMTRVAQSTQVEHIETLLALLNPETTEPIL